MPGFLTFLYWFVLCFGGGGATSLSSLDAQRAAAAAAAARRDARADGGAHGQLDAANATGTGAAGMARESRGPCSSRPLAARGRRAWE